MDDLFATGRIVDWIIALLVVEVFALLIWQAVTGAKVFCFDIISSIAAGLFLLLALRFAMQDFSWTWTALCLAAALVAHLASLWARGRVTGA